MDQGNRAGRSALLPDGPWLYGASRQVSVDSPFANVEPIFAKIFSLIRQEFEDLNFFEILSFMQALEKHITDNQIIENTFDYRPPT